MQSLYQNVYNMDGFEFSLDTTAITAMFLVFLALKLAKYINWSWWWVFSPLWIPAAIAIIIVIVCKIVFFIKNKNI